MSKYLRDEREIKGYVEVEYSDVNNGVEIGDSWIYPTESPISSWYNTNNKKVSQNYASLEQDYFLLDGSFVLPYMPENETSYYNNNSGYITNDIVEYFLNGVQLINTFIDGKVASGITIYLKDNIPENIEIVVETNATYSYIRTEDDYAESGKVYYIYVLGSGYEVYPTEAGDFIEDLNLYERQIDQESETLTYNITDNSNDIISFNFEEEKSISTLTMKFNDFEYENRRFRMPLIDFGLTDLLKDDRLMSFDIVENIGEINLDFPTNQLTVNLYDEDDVFDINNPKGYASLLNESLKVKFKPYLGILTDDEGIKYEELSTYYLKNWNNDNKNVTLNCVDYLEKMKNIPYVSYYQVNLDYGELYALDDELESYANIKFDDFTNFVDSSGKGYIEHEYLDTTDMFNYLSNLLVYLWGYMYSDKNKIVVGKRDENVVYEDTLTQDTCLLTEPKYTLKEKIKNISIVQYKDHYINNPIEDWHAAPDIYLTNSERAYNSKSEIVDLNTYHDLHVEARNVSQDIGIRKTFDASRYCPAVISPPTNITFYDLGEATFSTSTFIKDVNESGKEIKIDNKLFKQADGQPNKYGIDEICDNICNKIIDDYKTYNVTFDYIGDPNIKPNMILPIETQYGEKQIKVLKHTLKFNGGLTGTIEGVGD